MNSPSFSHTLKHVKLITTMSMLGFSAGLPLLLIFSTLSLWLLEVGVKRDTVTMFSWAALAYSFKFVWSPLVDSLQLPVLERGLGKRRSWLLLAQILMIVAILIMAYSQPNPHDSNSLHMMAMGAVLLGFSSATQDVVIDSYRIEIAPNDAKMQSALSAAYTAGYRVGMVVSGAGSLWMATYFGSDKTHYVYEAWRNTYFVMAAIMGLGVMTTLWIKEPEVVRKSSVLSARDNAQLLLLFLLAIAAFIGTYVQMTAWLASPQLSGLLAMSHSPLWQFVCESVHFLMALVMAILTGWLAIKIGIVQKRVAIETWLIPLTDFFERYGKRAFVLLALIGLYRISDIVAGVISNVFYSDLGFSKDEIAWVVKTFGVWMSIFGGFLGGLLAQRVRIMNMMMLGAVVVVLTNLLFAVLAMRGHDVPLMYTAVALDNLAAGLAGTVFVAFLSELTNIRFTAVQYALFSSLMTLFPKVLAGYSGSIVNHIGYTSFFVFAAALGVPILGLVWWADRLFFRGKQV